MLLILPVFLTIVFTIMEIGHLAFWMIVLNHAAYEAARVGALLAGPDPGGAPGIRIGPAKVKAQEILKQVIQTASCDVTAEPTVQDNQAGIMNQDLIVKASYDVHLVFPISNILLADRKGTALHRVEVAVRMPIEQPLMR